MFWNNTYSEDGMNLLVVSLGEKNAKDYCEKKKKKKKKKFLEKKKKKKKKKK